LIDGKLLVTGCEDTNAYTWDMSVVLKEAGLSDLLKQNVSLSFLLCFYRLNALSQDKSNVCHAFIYSHQV
jgi:hypothetical protein